MATATAELNVPRRIEKRADGFIVAFIVAAAFAALSSLYFTVNAGTDYPEPWTQMSD